MGESGRSAIDSCGFDHDRGRIHCGHEGLPRDDAVEPVRQQDVEQLRLLRVQPVAGPVDHGDRGPGPLSRLTPLVVVAEDVVLPPEQDQRRPFEAVDEREGAPYEASIRATASPSATIRGSSTSSTWRRTVSAVTTTARDSNISDPWTKGSRTSTWCSARERRACNGSTTGTTSASPGDPRRLSGGQAHRDVPAVRETRQRVRSWHQSIDKRPGHPEHVVRRPSHDAPAWPMPGKSG